MRVHVCGVRGSTPAPGAEFTRIGGHTSCLAVTPEGAARPTLVLDAGTGIRRVSDLLGGEPFEGAIVLTHLHWDHTQGLPFFAAADRVGSRVEVHVPVDDPAEGSSPLEVLARGMSPPHFPIRPDELLGEWRFHPLVPGALTAGGFRLTVAEVPHKGGRTMGVRVDDGAGSLAYVPDHGPLALGLGPAGLGALHPAVVELCRDVDLLVHDAQHTNEELARWAHYGHSAAAYAVELAEACGARSVLLFHHAPTRVDDDVEALARSLERPGVHVRPAVEGTVLELGRRSESA